MGKEFRLHPKELQMALNKDIAIDQGTTKREVFKVSVLTEPTLPFDETTNPYIPLQFNNHTAQLTVRSGFDSPTPLLTASTANGKVELNEEPGWIVVNFDPTDTIPIRFRGDSLSAVYDLEVTDNNDDSVIRVVQGSFDISREVTR